MKDNCHVVCLIFILTFMFVVNGENKGLCEKSLAECEKNKLKNEGKKLLPKVCGSDNVTYTNHCYLENEICRGKKVTLRYVGRCRTKQPCFRDVRRHHRLQRGSFIPNCLEDGRYAPIQCHEETGYCWCVTPNGRPIQSSSKLNRNPRCSRKFKMRRKASARKNSREICNHADKQKFNENLLNLFRAEYGKDLDGNADTTVMNQKILNWKFQSMDKNDDNFLQKSEYKILRKLKKFVKPKKCAKTFARLCDLDRDLRISKEEWSSCLGIGMVTLKGSEVASLSGQLAGYEVIKEKEEPEANDCLSDRQAVLSEQPYNNLYVPECKPDGRYNRVQCYKSTGYCWCVHEDDGSPIPGTSVKDQAPECDSIPLRIRPMKGCPGEKKRIFLTDLMDFLANKMITNNGTEYSNEKIAFLSFSSLDANNSKYLERKEWKTFRAIVANYKNLRRCGKRLPRFCDVNNDGNISMTEWSNCLDHERMSGLKAKAANFSALNNRFKGPRGQNPLTWKKLLSRLDSFHLCAFVEDKSSEEDVAAMTEFIEGGTHNSSSSEDGVSITVAASLFLLREFKKFPQGTVAVSGRIEIDGFSNTENIWKSHMNMTFTIPRNLTETSYKDTCVILTGPSWLLRLSRRSNVCIPSSINRTVTHIGNVIAVNENDTGTLCRRGSYIRLNYSNQSDEFFLSEKEKWNIYIRLIHSSYFIFIAALTFLCYFLIRGRMYSSVVKIPLTL